MFCFLMIGGNLVTNNTPKNVLHINSLVSYLHLIYQISNYMQMGKNDKIYLFY